MTRVVSETTLTTPDSTLSTVSFTVIPPLQNSSLSTLSQSHRRPMLTTNPHTLHLFFSKSHSNLILAIHPHLSLFRFPSSHRTTVGCWQKFLLSIPQINRAALYTQETSHTCSSRTFINASLGFTAKAKYITSLPSLHSLPLRLASHVKTLKLRVDGSQTQSTGTSLRNPQTITAPCQQKRFTWPPSTEDPPHP